MRRTVLTATALLIFGFGMTASMAQTQQIDPGTIKVNPPAPTSPSQIQTQPTQPQNLNTSQNPCRDGRCVQTPVQPPKR
jgi:hypothetical protein